jgi:protein TonB
MFQDVFIPRGRAGSGAWAMPLSMVLHAGLASLLILLPLLKSGLPPLPERALQAWLALPAPPSPPPPPARHAGAGPGRIRPVQAHAFDAGRFVAPVSIPDVIADEPLNEGAGGGQEGGIEGGVPGGRLEALIGPVLNVLMADIQAPVRAVGDVRAPKLLRRVEPVYPEIARLARIGGVVVLEAETDAYGRVKNVRILRSVPLLDQAALEAVRQWVYEPLVVNGRPRGVVFSVTVTFKLN